MRDADRTTAHLGKDAGMKSKTETIFGVIWGVIFRFAIIAGVIYFLFSIRAILVTVLISVMAAYVAIPAVNFLMTFRVRKWNVKWQRFWAALLVFVVIGAWLVGTVRLFIFPFQDELSRLSENLNDYVERAQKLLGKTAAWYGALPPGFKEFLTKQGVGKTGNAFIDWASKRTKATIEWLSHILDIILIPVIAFYFVLDSRSLKHEFVALVPRRRWRESLTLLKRTSEIMQTYVIGQLILCLIAGVTVGVVLWLLRMDYSLVLAVLAGVTRAIPIIGPIICGIPIVLLAMVKSTTLGVKVLIFFVILHFIESKVILPNLMSARVRLHPAVIIIVILIGYQFFGILGMFVAVPVAAVIREIARFYLIRPQLAGSEGETRSELSEPTSTP